MLDDIDYSDLTAAQPKAAPASEPKKKSNISERSVVKPSQKTTRKPVDVEAIAGKAEEMQTDVGAPEIPDPLAQYGLPALGALGALGTAYGVYKSLQNKNPPPPPPPPSPPFTNRSAKALCSGFSTLFTLFKDQPLWLLVDKRVINLHVGPLLG